MLKFLCVALSSWVNVIIWIKGIITQWLKNRCTFRWLLFCSLSMLMSKLKIRRWKRNDYCSSMVQYRTCSYAHIFVFSNTPHSLRYNRSIEVHRVYAISKWNGSLFVFERNKIYPLLLECIFFFLVQKGICLVFSLTSWCFCYENMHTGNKYK